MIKPLFLQAYVTDRSFSPPLSEWPHGSFVSTSGPVKETTTIKRRRRCVWFCPTPPSLSSISNFIFSSFYFLFLFIRSLSPNNKKLDKNKEKEAFSPSLLLRWEAKEVLLPPHLQHPCPWSVACAAITGCLKSSFNARSASLDLNTSKNQYDRFTI